MNYTSNRIDFRIVQGLDTPVEIYVRNVDRKMVDLGAASLTVRIKEQKTGLVRLISAILRTGKPGIYDLVIPSSISQTMNTGFYEYDIITSNNGVTRNLHTDRDIRNTGSIEVVMGIVQEEIVGVSMDVGSFLPSEDGWISDIQYMDGIVASYTSTTTVDKFVGIFTIQKTSDLKTAGSEKWVDVAKVEYPVAFTGTFNTNFSIANEKFRFKYFKKEGDVTDIWYNQD